MELIIYNCFYLKREEGSLKIVFVKILGFKLFVKDGLCIGFIFCFVCVFGLCREGLDLKNFRFFFFKE